MLFETGVRGHVSSESSNSRHDTANDARLLRVWPELRRSPVQTNTSASTRQAQVLLTGIWAAHLPSRTTDGDRDTRGHP